MDTPEQLRQRIKRLRECAETGAHWAIICLLEQQAIAAEGK